MTAREYFDRISEVERQLHAAACKVDLFRSMSEKVGPAAEGGPSSNSGTSLEDVRKQLADARDEAARLGREYTEMVNRITAGMRRLEDPEEEQLLTCLYLRHMNKTEIAQKMHRCRPWIYKHADSALNRLDRILRRGETGEGKSV